MSACGCKGPATCGHAQAAKLRQYSQVDLSAMRASYYAAGRLAERHGEEALRVETDKFLTFWKERYADRVEVLVPSMRIVDYVVQAWEEYEAEHMPCSRYELCTRPDGHGGFCKV